MNLLPIVQQILTGPTPAALWALYGQLLAAGADGSLLRTVETFHHYLCDLQSKATARQYSELASLLDIGSVGTLALQDILMEPENLLGNLLLGSLGEGLMVLASRQYVKAWEQELKSLSRRAAWDLYSALWHLSRQFQPDMAFSERQALIEATLAPALDDDTPAETKMLLLLRLFQIVLHILAAPLYTGQ